MNLLLVGAYTLDVRPNFDKLNATTRIVGDFWTRNDNMAAVAYMVGSPARVPASRTHDHVHTARMSRV